MRWMITLMLGMVSLTLAACDEEPESPEAADVRAAYMAYDQAYMTLDGETVVDHLTQRSIDYYDTLIDYALDGDRSAVQRLSPTDMIEVVRIRNRLEPAEVRQMSGRDLLVRAFSEDWYNTDEAAASVLELGRIDVLDDRASAMLIMEGEKTGHFLDFYREDGAWKLHFQSWDTLWNQYFDEIAREVDRQEAMSPAELVLYAENWERGSVKQDVARWRPMNEWR